MMLQLHQMSMDLLPPPGLLVPSPELPVDFAPPVEDLVGEAWMQAMLESGKFAYERQDPNRTLGLLATSQVVIMAASHRLDKRHEDTVTELMTGTEINYDAVRKAFFSDKYWWLEWPNNGYRADPFELPITEMHAVGPGEARIPIYNLGVAFTEAQQATITDTIDWYDRLTGGGATARLEALIIGDFHRSLKKDGEELLWHSLGLARMAQGVITIDHRVPTMQPTDNDFDLSRYKSVFDRQHSVFDVVLTHELAHILELEDFIHKPFMQQIGWGDEYVEPPTDYCRQGPLDDLAETAVFYRFAGHLLDKTRRDAFENALSRMHFAFSDSQYDWDNPAEIHRLPRTIYPRRAVPKKIELMRTMYDAGDTLRFKQGEGLPKGKITRAILRLFGQGVRPDLR